MTVLGANEFERGSGHRVVLVLSEHAIVDEFDATGGNYPGRVRCLAKPVFSGYARYSDVFLASAGGHLV